ncbi:SPOC like C-terminal domain-containing protein [Polychytrium aggregatum]|uniref:SPOC like C-terminal domain-containing protein n=1 Tax=Polychytrium aggregatum TaxID=110093 RepID=UPI0022FDE2D9|nr:SPOC like C-terminal domain-containing protein [Polychytrium aggregatum]KAI9207193.1 SPOC like C-terminal domain-containing protein [Polychytrium aggregatum]
MPPYSSFDDADSDAGDGLDFAEDAFETNRDGLLWVIDASPRMFVPTDDGAIPFKKTLECAARCLKSKIIVSDSDLSGILFYGTRAQRQPTTKFGGIYLLQNLDIPDVQQIVHLEKMVKDPSIFEEEIGSSDDYKIHEVLWACSNVFSANKVKLASRRVFIFTCSDNPAGEHQLRTNALTRASDLSHLGIELHVFPLPGAVFDWSPFWNPLLKLTETNNSADEEAIPDMIEKWAQLEDLVKRKENKKRTIFRVPWHISPDIVIGVAGYNLIMEQKRGSFVYLSQRDNREVKSATTWICEQTGSVLLPDDIDYFYPVGQRTAVFSKQELSEIRYFGEPKLQLLGFKPQESLMEEHNIHRPYFIFPDESTYSGSSSVFANLLDSCLRLNKVALCTLIARKRSPPRLVTLVPQRETESMPGGFHAILMPYADDLRNIQMPVVHPTILKDSSSALAEIGNKIIKKLNIKSYDGKNYENPVIQIHYTNLQALALQEDLPEEFNDQTLPKAREIHERAGELIQEFKRELMALDAEDLGQADGDLTAGLKRQSDAEDSQAKRAKNEVPDAQSIKRHIEAETLQTLTVAQLTGFLTSVRIKPMKRKPELVSQVEQYMSGR